MRARLLAVLVCSLPGAARAQGSFLDNSPGPLVRGHDRAECKQCHALGEGVVDRLCRDCHRTLERSSLHQSFGGRRCVGCHTDHQGATANISNWNEVGGRRSFDHRRTKLALTGVHRDVACTKCHQKKLASGRTSFGGLDPTCAGCHGNVHRFSSEDLLGRCIDCHGEGGVRKKMSAAELFFDHGARAGLALTGKHAKADCGRCHSASKMSLARKRSCASCHRKDSPHGPGFTRSECSQCHSVEAFQKPSFSHEKTRFPLRAAHDTKRCSKCHESPKQRPPKNCEACHADPHRERFSRLSCDSCHGLGGSRKVGTFDHARNGSFALTGRHSALGCRSCHRGQGPTGFERLDEGEKCRGCHVHQKAHDGQFGDEQCTSCHAEGGSKKLDFDHQTDTRFPLTGLHQDVECGKCHPRGEYRSGKLACASCHQDSHRGELGDRCDRCHSTETKFDQVEFDHDRQSRFELVRLHRNVECEKCHPSRRYKTNQLACADCHSGGDPHDARLGMDCGRCHLPDKGAPKFEHDLMTAFPLEGRHRETECGYCHQPKPASPPPVGWTKSVELTKLDLLFPRMGETCADCHFDVHQGRYGTDCSSCHDPGSFQASRAVHDTGAFRLMGRHDQLACVTCHAENRKLAGIGAQCFVCHQKDDEHNNALGFECGSCHQQLEWLPTRFNHSLSGYPLRGVHAAIQCRDCHRVGRYGGTPRDCQQCHGTSAMAVPDPPHGPEMTECATCHTEVSFAPARPNHPWYPLAGVHRTNRCNSCHIGGRYSGTPRECAGCHQAEYLDPRNDPNHVREGFSTDCTECHGQAAWAGARRPPR